MPLAFRSAQMASILSSARPMMAAIVPGTFSQHFCMALARCETSFRPLSNESAPQATSAENSPRECPATISGLKSAPCDLATATEWMNTAGCVISVRRRSSSEPLNMMSEILNPRIESASANNSFAQSNWSYRSLPMPENWAPCPGNTYAFIL